MMLQILGLASSYSHENDLKVLKESVTDDRSVKFQLSLIVGACRKQYCNCYDYY